MDKKEGKEGRRKGEKQRKEGKQKEGKSWDTAKHWNRFYDFFFNEVSNDQVYWRHWSVQRQRACAGHSCSPFSSCMLDMSLLFFLFPFIILLHFSQEKQEAKVILQFWQGEALGPRSCIYFNIMFFRDLILSYFPMPSDLRLWKDIKIPTSGWRNRCLCGKLD